MSNMLLKNEKYHLRQLQNLDSLTLTLFNKIAFPFISGHILIYYTIFFKFKLFKCLQQR